MPTLNAALELAQELVPVLSRDAPRIDQEGAWPEASLRALLERGLGGLVVPKRFGGMGLGLGAMVRVGEILGGACASTAMCFGMHAVAAAVIAAKASPEQEELLREIAAGRHLTTLALSEPGSGSHFYYPDTRLEVRPEGLAISGQKSFVTNGGRADSYVMSCASAEPDAPPGEFSCLIVPASAAGLSWGPEWEGLGMRGNSSRSVQVEVELPASALLGEAGDQFWFLFNVITPYFLSAMSGTYLGVAASALTWTVEHLKGRVHAHSERALAEAPVLQHRLGELWAALARTRCLMRHYADAADRGEGALLGILSSKAEVGDDAVQVVNECMTLAGGRGYSDAGGLGRHLRDLRAAHVMAPTTDILRTWVGRLLLDQQLLSD